jgi:hypothetical protein
MDTNQINCTLDSVPWIKRAYAGCFSVDKLPTVHSLPMAMVVNADPSSKPGSHWLALYFTVDRRCELFDSLGRHPLAYGIDFMRYANQFGNGVWQCFGRTQSAISNVCGQYCVYFIACRCQRISAEQVASTFNQLNREKNDRLVVAFFLRLSLAYRLLQPCRTNAVVQHSIPFI